MKDRIEVFGAPVVFTTEKPHPFNPLKRPKISYKKPVMFIALLATGIIMLSFWPNNFLVKRWVVITIFIVLYVALLFKKAIIWFVHLYQNKASNKTRLRCVFEPSCSEYMILAIEKHGTIIGIAKGIKRLLRCHPPNGGIDYP